MKKSLLAVAAIGAFASAAQAQSSVTVYGIIDGGFSSTSTRLGSTKTTNAGFIQGGNGNETSSRLGFRGTEDLGGGTSAFFTAEMELNMNSNASTTLASTANSSVLNGNRQAFVGLAKKGIGKAAVGTQYTVMHDAVAGTDPGESNNVVGSVLRPVGLPAAVLGNTSAGANHMVRTNNMFKVNSDKFAGFGVNAAYIQSNADSNQTATGTATVGGTGGTANFNGWNLGADYTWKKLFVTAAFGSVKQEQNALAGTVAAGGTVTAGTSSVGTTTLTTPSTITAGTNPNTTTNNAYVGGVYDFGILKAYAGWSNAKISSGYDSNLYVKRSAQQVGVRGMFTPTIEGWASVGNGRFTNWGTGTPTTNFSAWQLGSNYLLSKRTNLYAIYGQTVSAVSPSTGLTPSGSAASQYAMGVRHTF